LNINRQIIEEFVEDGADSEEHSTSVEGYIFDRDHTNNCRER
jgi:hypothetical protein